MGKVTPATKAALVAEIKRATRVHGNTVNLNYIDTSAITDMQWLFSNDRTDGYKLEAFNGDISKWDVSKVTDMSHMFLDATAFNQDISEWKVSKVTNMYTMFSGATAFNKNLNAWGAKINRAVKARGWVNTIRMFTDSGLANKLPSWCENVPACKTRQPS